MKEQKQTGQESKKLTRREFLKAAAEAALALLAAELTQYAGVHAVAAAAESEPEKEPKIDIPPGTYLTSQSDWTLRWLKRIPESVLEKYNGPKSCWSLPESGGVFLVPSSYFGGIDGVDELAKEKLSTRVTFRADVDRNEVTDEGWGEVELKLIQSLLPLAAVRNAEFFGKSRYQGFVRVCRPGKKDREAILQQPRREDVAGMVAEGGKPGTLRVLILTSLAEYADQRGEESKEEIVEGYLDYLMNLVTHELGHVSLLGTKLGSLKNHDIVYTLGISAGLMKLLGKSSEEILAQTSINDYERTEMLFWKAFKVKGIEFFAQLQARLMATYGEKRVDFSDEEVEAAANPLFKRAGFNFTYKDLLGSLGKIPDESKALPRPLEGYSYPVKKTVGDRANPEGMVSWWLEVPSLAPAPRTEKGWFRSNQIFPGMNGYYTSLKFIGNGRLGDGPPNKNSLAVATWKRGGSPTNGKVLFPPGMVGVETIRAEKTKK